MEFHAREFSHKSARMNTDFSAAKSRTTGPAGIETVRHFMRNPVFYRKKGSGHSPRFR
jgi:hypothetical protein